MGRPPGTQNVAPDEIALIRALYRRGVRLKEIVQDVGRSMSVVERAVRGLDRQRPAPTYDDQSDRNDRILELTESGMSRSEVGREVGLKPSRVGYIIQTHPYVIWLLRKRKVKPTTVARRYRMELSTAERIAKDADVQQVPRVRGKVT